MRKLLAVIGLLAGLVGTALAQAPPPVPALPDTQRITSYSLSSSLCNCAVGFALYGDGTDADNWIKVTINGAAYLSTDPAHGWFLSSPSGTVGSIALPITDAILHFTNPQSGAVQIIGARRPRRLSQFPENRGVAARDLNQALTDIVAQNRENWDLVRSGGGGGGGGGGSLTIGVTPIIGGTSGQCLNINGSVLGQMICGGGGGSSTIVLGTTPVSGTPPPVIGNCLSITSGPVVSQSACGGGGGGGGLSITRAQIPSNNLTGVSFFQTTGYSAANDNGGGAPYTCIAQSSTSVGAIQDSVGNWCAFDVNRVRNMGGFNPTWFGAVHNGLDNGGIQAAIDATYTTGINNTYCNGTFETTLPIYNDAPGAMRGGALWVPQFQFISSSTGGYQPGAVVSGGTTIGSTPLYANNDNIGYWGFPGSPDSTGYATDLSWQIVSSTASVTYNPSWTPRVSVPPEDNGAVIASFKGTGTIGTPNPLVVSGPGQTAGTPITTTGSAPAGALIVVSVQDISGNAVTGVTDNATGGANVYTRAVFVDNGTLGGIYIFFSTTGHALPAGGQITVNNPSATTISVIAFSVTNATGGLDKTNSVDNTGANTSGTSVATGVLAQSNEIVFAAITSQNGRISAGWTEPAGWTTATTSLWSPGAWNNATVYNAGDHVYRGGIPWSSLRTQSGNDPLNELGINVRLVNWKPINFQTSNTNAGGTFYGPPQLTPGATLSGCVIRPRFNNSVYFVMGYGNGPTLENVTFYPVGTTSGYCSQPITGAAVAILGTAPSGGGANRTLLRNVAAQYAYYGVIIGPNTIENFNNGGVLSAETKVDNLNVIGACVGYFVTNSQGFINNLTNSTIDATTAIWTQSPVGVAVYNGNISHTQASNATSFGLSAVTAVFDGVGLRVTGTLALAGDPWMNVSCTDPGGVAANNYNRFNNQCHQNLYNAWALKLSGNILVPLVLVAFNPGTGVATWRGLDEWLQGYGGVTGPLATGSVATALTTEINTQTRIWGAETSRSFVGSGITADQIHVETLQPYELVDTTWTAGTTQATILRNIYLNTEFTFATAYSPGNSVSEAQFFAAQQFSFIKIGVGANASGGNVILESVCCNTTAAGVSQEPMIVDLQSGLTAGDGRLIVKGGTLIHFNHRFPAAANGAGNMTGGSNWSNNGSAAFGQGDYDSTPFLGVGTINTGANDIMRSNGWNSGPFWGVRPAPWTMPCVSPAQYVTLIGTLPAISGSYTVSYPLLWSGQMYRICDWNMTPTVYSAGSTYPFGALVCTAALPCPPGSQYISRINGNIGNTPASSPTQWAPFFYRFVSNHGVGYSFGQNITFNWTIRNNYPWVQWGNTIAIPFFPGLELGLAGTQAGCTTQENFILREVHYTLQYGALFLTDNDVAGAMVPQFGAALCSNTVMNQAPYAFTGLN